MFGKVTRINCQKVLKLFMTVCMLMKKGYITNGCFIGSNVLDIFSIPDFLPYTKLNDSICTLLIPRNTIFCCLRL